jgi:hypothetical protein
LEELASETNEDQLVISVPLKAEETIAVELVNQRKSNEP